MDCIQYTVRSVPKEIDMALRSQAQSTGKSLNTVILAALAQGAGVSSGATYTDLDWFPGARSLDSTFEDAQAWLDSLPADS